MVVRDFLLLAGRESLSDSGIHGDNKFEEFFKSLSHKSVCEPSFCTWYWWRFSPAEECGRLCFHGIVHGRREHISLPIDVCHIDEHVQTSNPCYVPGVRKQGATSSKVSALMSP